MSDQTNIKRINSAAIIDAGASTYAVTTDSTDFFSKSSQRVDWEADPVVVSGKDVVPYGVNNDLPDQIRQIMDRNNLAPGILEREVGLLHGQGPAQYEVTFENGQINRQYTEDPEVTKWLADWNYKRFIDMATVEFKYLKGYFAKRYRNRAPRIGRAGFITNLEVIPATDARLAWPRSGPKRLESVKEIYVGDFSNNCYDTGITTYPVYDHYNPFRHPVSVGYHNRYSFGLNFYATPGFYGSLPWMERSSDIPEVLAYLSENGITSAYHIISPGGYWESKREKLEKKYPDKTDAQIDKLLDELQDEIYGAMAKTLTGKKNTGKFIKTVSFYDNDDHLCEWKVEAIDQKIKDFVDAQLKISEKADSAITSGIGLHPSLSNIIVNGQLSSGSQMLYALKLYMASDTTIPEEVIFEPINQAIAANFPKSKVRMGFYHHSVQAEQEINPEDRLTKTAEGK